MTGMIDAYASQPHYVDHLAPVWLALPNRGLFTVARPQLVAHAARRGVTAQVGGRPRRGPVLVAGAPDFAKVPMALLEHGAGQTYEGRHPSYPGGRGRDLVGLFLCPSVRVVEANRAHYPRASYAVVGCPKLDRWFLRARARHDPPVVALSFHWRNGQGESRSALPHYRSALAALAAAPFRVIGHAHPRALARIAPLYHRAGIEVVADFEDVLERADLFAADNTSALYEFAATGRPVVLLDAPWYRRGALPLRFGDAWDVGIHATGPGDLVATIGDALLDPPEVRERRRAIMREVYAVRDGTSALRAAEAIAAWLAAGRLEAAA